MKKNNPLLSPKNKNVKGFSLLEFLIASLLSMIVLIAVSSSYFTARTLNQTANSRINIQQDLRNASNLIVRDARMAGSFGCFNMSAYESSAVINEVNLNNSNTAFQLKTTDQTTLTPIKTITAASFTPSGFRASSNALVFQYGVDSENTPSAATTIVSSCHNITYPNAQITTTAAARTALGINSRSQDSSISIMRYTVNAYAVGSIGNQTGMFRFSLADNGTWGNPQLLVKGIDSMAISYVYTNSCPETGATAAGDETFSYTKNLMNSVNAVSPALIRIRLNNGSINTGNNNNVQVYNIDATVRGGNTCADRAL